MAPLKSVKKDNVDKRLQSVLESARTVLSSLNERKPLQSGVVDELENHVKRSLPFPSSTALAGKYSELDHFGTRIWNAATNLIREQGHEHSSDSTRAECPRWTVLLRLFGYLLVDAAHHTSSRRTKDNDQRVRTFKIGLKACRFCIDAGQLELAVKAFERCSEYASAIDDEGPIVHIADDYGGEELDRQAKLRQFVCEYYLLRMTHAWKSDRFDMAELFYNKISRRELAGSAPLTEKAADLLHKAGLELEIRDAKPDAIKWCERAIDVLDGCNAEQLGCDTPELRLAITSTYVEAIIGKGDQQANGRASDLVTQLESSYGMGNRMTVALLHYRILAAQDPVDVTSLSKVMAHMIKIAVLTDKNFKTIVQTIHKTRKVDVQCSLAALENLINMRLLPDISPTQSADDSSLERLEKAVVAYVLLATTEGDALPSDTINALTALLNGVSERINRTFSPKVTHAAQTLIWRRSGALDDPMVAEWCQLLRHPVFDGAGQVNKAKVGRKAIAAALAIDDINAAREAYYHMPIATQNESVTRYLMFKVALRDEDHDMANDSLIAVSRHADKDASFLYACVLEAQQSRMRPIAVASLQRLVDTLPHGVHLPSLLRCTARLLISEIEAHDQVREEMIEELVKLFERAASNSSELKKASGEQWRSEVQWWSKNAYNLALRFCGAIPTEHLMRLLRVCVHFLDLWPNDAGMMHEYDIARRKLLCQFLCATAYVVLARSAEEGSEYRMQSYLQARREIAITMQGLQSLSPEGDQQQDMIARQFELLKLDMECILHLQQWQNLKPAVQAFLNFQGADRWDSLADLVIVIHDHLSTSGANASLSANAYIPELLQKCINQTWKRDKDITKMSRWLRLAFQLNLNDANQDFALKIVQQAATIAQRGYEMKDNVYPRDELQWLATTTFNKAIESLTQGEREVAGSWMDEALELARYAEDNGSLHATLTRKREHANTLMKERKA